MNLRERFPNASAAFLALNSGQTTVVERGPRNAPLEKGQVQTVYSGRVRICITSFRRRLLDEDNLCEKYLCDCLRYAGIISGDSPDKAKIEVSQVKISSKEPERTQVNNYPML